MKQEFEFIVHTSDWRKTSQFISWEIMEKEGHGFARLYYFSDEKGYLLSDLYVDTKYRKQGMATQIINTAKELMSEDKHLGVFVHADAPDWITAFYLKNNMVVSYEMNFSE